jgi:hypothetical protein
MEEVVIRRRRVCVPLIGSAPGSAERSEGLGDERRVIWVCGLSLVVVPVLVS